MSFNLISWENERIEIPVENAAAIKFLEHVPEPGEDVPLSDLEIDISTLVLIQKFLEIRGEYPVIKKPMPASRNDSVFDPTSPFTAFFADLNEDQLLLLTLAAHKLTIETLQELCTAVIASKFAEMDAQEVINDLTEEELTTNEDDYYKWTGFQWH
jgi:hypothetical protein